MKKNLVPFGMLFTQIIRNIGVNVSAMEVFARASQLKGVTFEKIGIAEIFPKYAQKHIKKKVKKGGTIVYGRTDDGQSGYTC